MQNKIICQNNLVLKPIEKDYKYYLNRTTLIFGRTNSGKSTILNEILYICKNYIPNVWVISRTNNLNDNFSKMVPKLFIKKDLNNDFLFNFLERQKSLTSIYKMVNDVNNLYSLFIKIASSSDKNIYSKINIIKNTAIDYVNNNKYDFDNYRNEISKIKKMIDDKKISFMKNVIDKNKDNINKETLTKKDKNIIHYLYLNPNTLIVLDDCASSFKLWYKSCKQDVRSVKYGNPIKSLFYEGRWMNVTLIITAQDDKEIDPELRKNALVSIFTTEESVMSSFTRTANSHPPYIRKKAEIFSRAIFGDKNKNNYKKLVYLKIHGECPFRYVIASLYDNFKMGSKYIWELSKKILEQKNNEENNKYLID